MHSPDTEFVRPCTLPIDLIDLGTLKVSGTVRTRGELEKVQNKVEARLATLQARPGAVCAVRESVFSELYDEVIREVNHSPTSNFTWMLLCEHIEHIKPLRSPDLPGIETAHPRNLNTVVIEFSVTSCCAFTNAPPGCFPQITLQCPERGLLLLRLRDETRMNLDTYAEIYRWPHVVLFPFSMKKKIGVHYSICTTHL